MGLLRILSVFGGLSLGMLTLAQQINITAGSAVSCSGVIEDSGGPSAPYSDNESITFTICPDVPGNVIYLTWFVFNLSTAGNNDDNLTIYDGDNTSALTLGTYTGTALQNLIVSGTVFNTTGCLTLVFQSNGTGTGEFAAGFQCTVPCQNPMALASMSEPAPARICQGETVTFDGSASYAQASNTLVQYLWDFDDGTVDSTSGAIASHAFDEPGEYIVQLFVSDNNDCSNLNLVDLQVLVSTTPTFNQTDPSTEVCFGESVSLFGHADPVTWTGIPDANFGEGVFLPDDVGLPFTSSLVFEQFDAGQTVTSMSDIQSICVEMEHTFMGDLVLQVICPNGQTVILHQQGGLSTYLGSPNDLDSNDDPIFGECWQYCWDPNATNGTWIENLANTTVAGTPPSASLNPGTYESVQPMSNLIGCPLNGEWIYQSTDLWAIDNGFICSWSINFDPAIVPDITQFTPSFGPGADSSLWNGGTVPDQISANGDTITITPSAPGVYPFVYQVTDNFGCTYDTTITVTVADPFVVDAGPDVVICNDPVQLEASVIGVVTSCEWTLQMDDSAWDSWNGANLTISINGVPTNYTCDDDQTIVSIPVGSGDGISLTYTPGFWEGEVSYILFDDLGNIVFQDGPFPAVGLVWSGTATCNGQSGMTWEWTPIDGLSDPTVPDPTADVTSETEFFVTAYPAGHPACAATDSIVVSLDPALDPGADSIVVICPVPPALDLFSLLGGTPEPGGEWTDANGTTVSATFDPTVDVPGVFTYTVISPGGCSGTAQVEIQVLAATDPACCSGTVDAGPDAVVCDLVHDLQALAGGTGVGSWSGPAGFIFADPSDPQTQVTAPSAGPATFYWTESNGTCSLVDSVVITFIGPLAPDVTTSDTYCAAACDGTATITVGGGNGPFIYTWSNELAGPTPDTVEGVCAGAYSVTVEDSNGCTATTDFTVSGPPQLEVDAGEDIVSCGGEVQLQATATGDFADLVWDWAPIGMISNPGIPDPIAWVDATITYSVWVYPSAYPECAAMDSLLITFTPTPNAGTDTMIVVCATPPAFELIDMLGGAPDPGGTWTDMNGETVDGTFDPSVDPSGSFAYTISSPAGCESTAYLHILVLPSSDPSCCGVVDAGQDAISCGLVYTLQVTSPNIGSGSWSGPAGYVIASPQNAETDVTASVDGPATFYWTESDGANCLLMDSVTITFTQPLSASITTTDAYCTGTCSGTAQAVVVGGTAPFFFFWSDGLADSTAQEAATICAGSYSLDVEDLNGCTTTVDFTIDEPVQLEVDAGTDTTICAGQFQLEATVNTPLPDLIWQWAPVDQLTDPTSPGPTAWIVSNTVYSVWVYPNGYPECAAVDSIAITVDPELDPGVDSLIVICPTPPSFLLIDMLGGSPGAGGSWTDASGTPVPPLFDPTTGTAGTHTYTLVSPAGCVSTAHLEIILLAGNDPSCCGTLSVSADTTLCGLSGELIVSSSNSGPGTWSGPAGYVITDPATSHTGVLAPGSGSATFYWTDANTACQLVDSITITFTEPITLSVQSNDPLCHGTCDGNASAQITGGNGGFDHLWSGPSGTSTDSSANGLCAGSYGLEVWDVNGCTASIGFVVNEPEPLQIDTVMCTAPLCHGACDGAITIIDPLAVQYSFDGGLSFSATPSLGDICSGNYDVLVTNANGCPATGSIWVPEPPPVIADFDHTPDHATVEAPVFVLHNLSQNATSWTWDLGGMSSSTDEHTTFTTVEPGIYELCLSAFDVNGCADSMCKAVTIEDVLFTYVPNAFTPNGDGFNDHWGMTRNIDALRDFELRVFDRWGGIVFETNDPTRLWDGSFRDDGGEIVKEDVYAYRIVYHIDGKSEAREFLGHVTVLK